MGAIAAGGVGSAVAVEEVDVAWVRSISVGGNVTADSGSATGQGS